jgi:PAS domain S-box-containing protein
MANDEPTPTAAAQQIALDQQRAALALAASGMGEFEWDIARGLMIIGPRMAEITGMAAGVAPANGGRALYAAVHPDDIGALREAMREELWAGDRFEKRFRIVRPDDGRVRWVVCSAMAIPGGGAPRQRVIGVVQDVTEQKGEEDGREALVAELDHRVKNVLASVQSMALQSARKTVSLEVFLKTFAGRLEAMASAHTLLTATRWRGAEIANIAAAELGGLAPGQAHWRGPDVVLNPRATNALTLALHELATNAVKYGALSSEAGHVDVTWRALATGGFELDWQERDGPSVSPPQRRGFGSTLLDRVTGRELGGSAVIEFRPDGVRAVIIADASALARGASATEAPVVAAPAAPLRSEPVAPGASAGATPSEDIRGVKILIVEDAVLLALELESGLIEAGAQVVGLAATLAEAQSMLSLDFQVAVLDANLNGQSVLPVAHALSARGTPFIFATGYGDAGPAPEGFDAPVVRKPYNVHQIAAALVEALKRHKLKRH